MITKRQSKNELVGGRLLKEKNFLKVAEFFGWSKINLQVDSHSTAGILLAPAGLFRGVFYSFAGRRGRSGNGPQ